MSVLRSAHYQTPLKYRCPINISNRIGPAYLIALRLSMLMSVKRSVTNYLLKSWWMAVRVAETGLQVSTHGINCALHLLDHWCPHSHQSVENQATHWSQSCGSVEAHLPYVCGVLPQHCSRECQLAIHSCFFHANYQVFHTSHYRYDFKRRKRVIVICHLDESSLILSQKPEQI